MKKALFLPVALLFSLAPIASAGVVVWSQDFQSMTPGSLPSGIGVSTVVPAGTQVVVVDDSTTTQDPFGPAGNHSLMLEKTASGPHPKAIFEFGSSHSAGTLVFSAQSFYSSPSFTQPMITVTLYSGNPAQSSNIGAWFWISNTGIAIQDGATLISASNVWPINNDGEIKIEFFEDATYSIWLNDVAVTAGSKTVFRYYNASAVSLDRLQISIGDSSISGGRIFVDDMSLAVAIPEPQSIALLGMAAGALLFLRRKQS